MPELTRPDPRWRPDPAAVRLAIRRSRWPRVVLVLVVAILVGGYLDRAAGEAAEAADAWAPLTDAWVAATDLEAGITIGPADVVRRSLPAIALPRDPVRESPVGRRLHDDLVAGEIVRDGRLTDGAAGPLAARLPGGTGGVRLLSPAPHLAAGDVVDLYALLSGEQVARGAEVISVDDGMPTVAIATNELPAVVRSFTTGDVVPVLVG
jgi:SAF domain-containing protein